LEHAPRDPNHTPVLSDLHPELGRRPLGVPAGFLGEGGEHGDCDPDLALPSRMFSTVRPQDCWVHRQKKLASWQNTPCPRYRWQIAPGAKGWEICVLAPIQEPRYALTKGLLHVLLSHPCPRCGHKHEKKGSWFRTITTTPVRPAAIACEWATMLKPVFSRRTLTGRSSSLIRPADRRSGVSTLDQGQSRGSDELVGLARRALGHLGARRVRSHSGRTGPGPHRALSARRSAGLFIN